MAIGILVVHFPLGFTICSESRATLTAVITGILIVFFERVTLFFYRTWEEWISFILGAWLVICPWILGVSFQIAQKNFLIVGLLVMILTFYEVQDGLRRIGNHG